MKDEKVPVYLTKNQWFIAWSVITTRVHEHKLFPDYIDEIEEAIKEVLD